MGNKRTYSYEEVLCRVWDVSKARGITKMSLFGEWDPEYTPYEGGELSLRIIHTRDKNEMFLESVIRRELSKSFPTYINVFYKGNVFTLDGVRKVEEIIFDLESDNGQTVEKLDGMVRDLRRHHDFNSIITMREHLVRLDTFVKSNPHDEESLKESPNLRDLYAFRINRIRELFEDLSPLFEKENFTLNLKQFSEHASAAVNLRRNDIDVGWLSSMLGGTQLITVLYDVNEIYTKLGERCYPTSPGSTTPTTTMPGNYIKI